MKLAQVDGEEVPSETALLEDIARKWRLSDNDLKSIRRYPAAIPVEIPADGLKRTRQLYDLIVMIVMIVQDGRITRDEEHFTHARAKEMGFFHHDVDQLIKLVSEQCNVENSN